MELRELLNYIEFDCYYTTNKEGARVIKLKDMQHVNLGNIEDDEFKTVAEIIDRCEIYWNDYVIRPLCEDMEISEFSFLDWNDLYNQASKYYKDDVDNNTILGYLIHSELVELGEIPYEQD